MSLFAAQALFFAAAYPDWFRWRRAARDPAKMQENILRQILAENAATKFGRQFGFRDIRSRTEYQRRVPLSSYETIAPAIDRMLDGESDILCEGQPKLFQPTSGTSCGRKYIPYNAGLKKQFLRAVNAWLFDLYLHNPRLFMGQAYWQISPALIPSEDHKFNRVGFDDDSEYLSPLAQKMWCKISAIPPELRLVGDPHAFRYLTALFLLRTRNLRLISVWSPSFLLAIFDTIRERKAELLSDISAGGVQDDTNIPAELRVSLGRQLKPQQKRARELAPLLNGPEAQWHHAWPKLGVISCWTDGFAGHFMPRLNRLFPGIKIQGKGLLATEGVVSFPLSAHPAGSALAMNSHFLEFIECGNGDLYFADQLKCGRQYSVVLTTSAGLYRYQLDDVVEVMGFAGRVPLVRFIRRESCVNDFTGEKLHESHVQESIESALENLGLEPVFVLLACEKIGEIFRYCLFYEGARLGPAKEAELLRDIEEKLSDNIHYRYCRAAGQLGPLEISYTRKSAFDEYVAEFNKRGIITGNVKPGLLARGNGWGDILQPSDSAPNN